MDFKSLYVSAIIIVIVNSLGILYCKLYNKDKEAQRYYKHFEPSKFYVMEFCYTILVISLTYNLRFLVIDFGKMIKDKLYKMFMH